MHSNYFLKLNFLVLLVFVSCLLQATSVNVAVPQGEGPQARTMRLSEQFENDSRFKEYILDSFFKSREGLLKQLEADIPAAVGEIRKLRDDFDNFPPPSQLSRIHTFADARNYIDDHMRKENELGF